MPAMAALFALIVGLFGAVASNAQLSEKSGVQMSTDTPAVVQQVAPPRKFEIPVRIVSDPQEEEDTKAESKRSAERELLDLAAQQSMANSTQELVMLTKVQIVLGFLGTIGLIVTLWLNWKSTNVAMRASRGDRAWVVSHGSRADMVTQKTAKGTTVGVAFVAGWKNCGRSPSVQTECLTDLRVIMPGEKIPTFQLDKPVDGVKHFVVGADGIFNSNYFHLGGKQYLELQAGRVRAILYSRVTYLDIYGEPHQSEACLEFQINGETLVGGVAQPNFHLWAIGPQNTVT